MKITLRERRQGRKISLYLDYYSRGFRKAEYLRLYLVPNPKTRIEKDLNKETRQLAESIRAKRIIEVQKGIYGFDGQEKDSISLLKYIAELSKRRYDSRGNYGNWESMLKHLRNYIPQDISFRDVDRLFVQGFKDYLDQKARTKGNRPLSQNSKYSYFNKFKAALKQALKDQIIIQNPSEGVEAFKQDDPIREFLTLEELQRVADTECEIPILKTAFIFSCLTGLRWSDIQKLTWSELQFSETMGHFIRYKQKKTKGAETLPISDQAFTLLGERKEPERIVFEGLKYSAWHNLRLQQWMLRAGIKKSITFHCARHTYATLQLNAGTDIYTVSKLLGHRELKTTQVYAKIIDGKKKEAADRIRIDLKNEYNE